MGEKFTLRVAGKPSVKKVEKKSFFKVEHIEEEKKVHSDLTRMRISNALKGNQKLKDALTGNPNHNRIVSPEECIQRFKNTHGDKYDYSKVKYRGSRIKVTIICPIHGEFLQNPIDHWRGAGCPKCKLMGRKHTPESKIKMSKKQEEVINNFRKVHGDTYDYSKVNYVNNNTKVIIICKIHGEFETRPRIHLGGSGCPKCARLKTNKNLLEGGMGTRFKMRTHPKK